MNSTLPRVPWTDAHPEGQSGTWTAEAGQLFAERPEPRGGLAVLGQCAWLGRPAVDEVASGHAGDLRGTGEVDRGPGARFRTGPQAQDERQDGAQHAGHVAGQAGP